MSFLQIASWNIEHLSGVSREKRKQSIYALSDHIEMSGIDILVLQEVYVTHTDKGERRNEDIDGVIKLLKEHLGFDWEYEIYPNRHSGDESQLCAIMWNDDKVKKTDVKKIDVPHKLDGMNLWDRAPHAVKFTRNMNVWKQRDDNGKWFEQEEDKSIVIVPLHMKSNYGGATKNRIVRGLEARVLCEKLDEVRDMDPSIILIGDTNCLNAFEPAIETFVTNGLIDLNNTDRATYWSISYGESPFDRAFISEGRPEFKYTRQYILQSSDLELHDKYLSDHYMIKISVKSYVDDADPRPTV